MDLKNNQPRVSTNEKANVWVMPLVIFAIGLIIAGVSAYEMRTENETEIQDRFDRLTGRVITQLQERLRLYERGLYGTRSAIISLGRENFNRKTFSVYIETRDIEHDYPGAHGFGYIRRVAPELEDEFLDEARRDGKPDFSIKQIKPHDGEHFVIQYIEPEERNRQAIGLDLASEPNRREAVLAATKTGKSALTAPITLVQAKGNPQQGFLMVLPVIQSDKKKSGAQPVSGWVYAPLVIEEVLADFDFHQGIFSLELSDVSDARTPVRFFSMGRSSNRSAANGLFKRVDLSMYGRTWSVEVTGNQVFLDELHLTNPLGEAVIAMGFTTLLAALAYVYMLNVQRGLQTRLAVQIGEAAPEALLVADERGVITSANLRLLTLFGYTANELIGQKIEVLLPERFRTHHVSLREQYDQTARNMGAGRDLMARHKDGHEFPVEISLGPLRIGNQPHVIAMIMDITRRKQLTEDLELYRLMIEKSGDPFFLIDDDDNCRMVYVNEATVKHFGVSREEILTWRIPDWDPNFSYDMLPQHVDQIKTLNNLVIESTHRIKGGNLVPVEISLNMVTYKGRLCHFGYFKNISDRKKTEQLLLESKNAAESANRAKSEFLASMSHELRTPLNAILGFSQLLTLNMQLPEQTRKNAREIERAGEHLLSLVNDIIDLARIESGKLELSLEPVQVRTVVKDSLAMVTSLAQKYNVNAIKSKCSEEEFIVWADYVRLRQVVINLLSNAIKYNRPQGTVDLTCEAKAGSLRIRVTDTGIGIPAEKQFRIFNSFDRLGVEMGKVEGTGIGLVITKNLIEAMGGIIGFESVLGQGSTFWVELPLVASAHALAQAQPARGNASPVGPDMADKQTNQLVVLYIEDNPMNMRLMQQIFEDRKNIELLDAHTAEIGIKMARERRPALILMDINLPGMNGYKALSFLKADERTAHIPVIAITANAMAGDRERGLNAGFADYLIKPLDVDRLLNTVGRYI